MAAAAGHAQFGLSTLCNAQRGRMGAHVMDTVLLGGKTALKDEEQNLEVKGNQLQTKIPLLFKARKY